MADNYWILDEYDDDRSKKYDNPIDVTFIRDIDPTVIPESDTLSNVQGVRPDWVTRSNILQYVVDEAELPGWPFLSDAWSAIPSLITKDDGSGKP